jgi:predicted extracellular nuclease
VSKKTSLPLKRRLTNARRISVFCLILALVGISYLSIRLRIVDALSITTLGSPITQNFDTLPASGSATWTNDSTLPGWYHARTGTGTTIVANDGVSNAGNLYSYGTGTATDRALGSIGSGGATAGNFFWGIRLTNNTGSTITSLAVSYVGEEWRNSAAAAQTVSFSYLVGSPTVTGSLAEFQSAGVAVTALDFTSPVTGGTAGALNGNLAANRTALSSTITGLSIPNGTDIMLRWSDPDQTGSDHGLSIDDFSVTPNPSASTNPSGTGAASPSTVQPGGSTLLTVTVTPGTNPTSTGLAVTGDLTAIGGSATQTFFDNGTNGDATIGDNIFSFQATVSGSTTAGLKSLPITITDTQARTGNTSISLTVVVPASNCGDPFTPIYTIQGSGTASPMNTQSVATEGIVIGDFQSSANLSGFYIQDPNGDANTATSDGLFVFDGAAPGVNVSVGDRVRVIGTVSEASTNTQINPIASVAICSTGNTLPTPVNYNLPEPVNDDLERVENMLVTFPGTLTVTGNFTEGRFGEVVLSSQGRLFQQNSFDRPGSAGSPAVAALNARRYIYLDDGKSASNVDPTPYFNAVPTRRVGDTTTGLTGVLTFDFSQYRVQPTGPVTFVDANPRPAAPMPPGGVRAVGMNVLNYFNTFGNGNCAGGPGGAVMDCRGANDAAEFSRQRNKIIAAIVAMNPDVVGVSEMENDGDGASSAIQDLVNGLNTATSAGTYAFVNEPGPGTDAIKVAMLYKPGVLSLVGASVNDSNPVHNRPPLAQTFQQISNNEKFTFIVNHFKSKGGTCPGSGGDADAGDGQGCFNATRVAQANALLTFIQQRKAAAGDPDVLSVGDYNAYGEEDPMFTLEQDASDALADGVGGLYSQTKRYIPAADRYSYQFGNESGELDHALATKTMHQQITGTSIFHNNADEPIVLDYNVEFKSPAQQAINVGTAYRTSDHDPVVIGMTLLQPSAANGVVSGRITDPNGMPVSGAVVNLSGTQNRKFITDANGSYRFDNVETNGFYTVRPSRVNFNFSPAERSFSQLGVNTEATFTGARAGVGVNAIDTPEYFVRQNYLDFLGREPDESGFNFWSDQILACGSDAACSERQGVNVSAAYFLSIEFQQTGGLIDALYRASYARAPRYAEFMPDTAVVARDVIVGRSNWAQQLEANKQAFLAAWVERADFRAAYEGLGNDAFVDTLINHGGAGFNGNRDALVSGLNNGGMTRAAVLGQVVENEGFINAKRNEAFVMMEYFGYLRRDPDTSGYGYWLNKLNQFDGNFERGEMVRAFINSGEYHSRFQQ